MKKEEIFLLYEKEVAEFKLDLIRRLSKEPIAVGKVGRRRTSNMVKVEKVLESADRPLHISEIITAIEKDFGVKLDRDSLSSAIVKQIRKGKRFVRVAPNTFGPKQT